MADTTQRLQIQINRLRAGAPNAGGDLIAYACHRLEKLARKLLAGYPNARRRGMETGDLVSEATLKLMSSLREVPVKTPAGFFGLAALTMRRLLIDLTRRCQPDKGVGGSESTNGTGIDPRYQSAGPATLAEWTEFHSCIDLLPREQREVFDLLYYMGLSQDDAAEQLGVSVRTIKRRWREAREAVHDRIHTKPGN